MGLTAEEIAASSQGAIPKEVDENKESQRNARVKVDRGEFQEVHEIDLQAHILEGVKAVFRKQKNIEERLTRIETKLTAFLKGEIQGVKQAPMQNYPPQQQFFKQNYDTVPGPRTTGRAPVSHEWLDGI